MNRSAARLLRVIMCFAMAHMSACCAIDPTCGRISEGVVFVEPYVIDKCGSLEHLYKVSEDCAKSKCDNDEHCEALRTYHQQIVAGIERMFGGTRWVVRKPINLPSPEVIAGMATASGGQDFRKVSDQVTLPVDLLNALEDAVSSTLGTDYTVKMDKTQTDSNNRDGSSPPGVTYHIVRGQKVCTIGAVLRNKRTGVVDEDPLNSGVANSDVVLVVPLKGKCIELGLRVYFTAVELDD